MKKKGEKEKRALSDIRIKMERELIKVIRKRRGENGEKEREREERHYYYFFFTFTLIY